MIPLHKHDIYPSMERSCDSTPSGKCFTISTASTPVSVTGPSSEIIASFACCGANIGEMRISGFGSWQTKYLTWNHGKMSRQAKLTGTRGHMLE